MKKTHFTLLPLAVFVAANVYAENTTNDTLDLITVVEEHTGAKSKTNVVTTQDINKSTETELRGLLKEEPSINFGGGRATSQWFTIRGMGQDQVDVKVDNTYSDTQIFHHQGRFLFDPSLVKVVNVQKGTGSASAGIGATSGSIIMKTVDAKDLLANSNKNWGFKINGGVSSNKGYNEGATFFAKMQRMDVLFAGNWVTEKTYKDGQGTEVKNSALGQRGLLAKIGVDLNENHRVVLSHRQERTHGVRALREEFDFTLTDPTSTNNNPRYRITTQDTSNLEWTGKNMGFISHADANIYRMVTVREETDNSSRTKVITNGANLNLDSNIGDSHVIKYGVNWRQQEGRPNSLGSGFHRERKTDTGAYVEGLWGFGPVILTTGLRYDHFKYRTSSGKEISDGNWNPSVGAIWEVTKDLSFNTSLNYATRSPRLYEVMLAGSRYITASDDLKAERSRNVEVGFNYDLTDAFSVNGSYFWQEIKDVQAISSSYQLYNGGKLKNDGYEVGVAYRYGGLKLRAGVAYSKPKMDGATIDSVVTAIPVGRTWTTAISYKFENPRLEIGWKGRFVQHTSYDSTTNNRGGGTTTTKRAGYGVNDIYATWEVIDNLNINFAIDNVFNKYYRSHSQRAGTSALPATGRDFRLSFNYTF